MCATIQTGAAQVRQGAVKGIAVMAERRVPIVPDVATTGEQGLPGVEASVWNAFFVPKGTPQPIVRKLNAAMSDTLDDPAIRGRLGELGLEIVPPERRTPEYLATFVPAEIERWGKVVRAAGISAEWIGRRVVRLRRSGRLSWLIRLHCGDRVHSRLVRG
jgi:tripartite-type tricarboxylate transporter receptor subunit TctC